MSSVMHKTVCLCVCMSVCLYTNIQLYVCEYVMGGWTDLCLCYIKNGGPWREWNPIALCYALYM